MAADDVTAVIRHQRGRDPTSHDRLSRFLYRHRNSNGSACLGVYLSSAIDPEFQWLLIVCARETGVAGLVDRVRDNYNNNIGLHFFSDVVCQKGQTRAD